MGFDQASRPLISALWMTARAYHISPLFESGANLWYHIICGFDNRPPTVLVVCIIFFVLLFGPLFVLLSERAKCPSIIAPSS
jgi:hypothetical protein